MKFIQNYEKFKESRNWSNPKSVGLNPDQQIKWSDVKEGIRVLQHQQLNEGFFGDLYNKAKSGLLSITSKIPGLKKLSQNKEIEQVASNLLQRGDIDDMLKKAYDKVMREKGEVTPNTIEEVAEEEEQRPLILPAIGSKQLGELTSKQKWIGRGLLFLILMSVSIKASGMDKESQIGVKLDKTEVTKNLKVEGGDEVKSKTIKLSDAMTGGGGDPMNDGKINYLHSSSSASQAYQSELGKGGDFDKGLQRGSDGSYNHVYEISLGEFYKIVNDIKTGKLDRSQSLSRLKALPETPNSNNPNLFQIGDESLRSPNAIKANKLFDLRGKDGATKIRLSGNGLYNFGRLIEAASKLGDGEYADFVKVTFGSDVDDNDARGAFGFSFDAEGIGNTIKANLNKCYSVMRAAAFTTSDFEDPYKEDQIPSLIPQDRLVDERGDDGKVKQRQSVNFFKTVWMFTDKDGKDNTLQDIINTATEEDPEAFTKSIRGICKFRIVDDLFVSYTPGVPDLLTPSEIKNLGLENVDDGIIKQCVKYFSDLKNSPDEERLKAQLSPDLEKKFLDEVERVVKVNVGKYIDYKLSQSQGDPYRSLPKEVLEAIKEDVSKQLEKKIGISKLIKTKDLKQTYGEKFGKFKSPDEKQKESDKVFAQGDF